MRSEWRFWVYIVSSVSGTLYAGVTNDIDRRVKEHKKGLIEGFSKKHRCTRLVYYERFDDVHKALSREKQLKRWRREKKIALIESTNPRWLDLNENWGKRTIFPGESVERKPPTVIKSARILGVLRLALADAPASRRMTEVKKRGRNYPNLVQAFTNPGQEQIACLLIASSRIRCARVSISISAAEASPRFSIVGSKLRTISATTSNPGKSGVPPVNTSMCNCGAGRPAAMKVLKRSEPIRTFEVADMTSVNSFTI